MSSNPAISQESVESFVKAYVDRQEIKRIISDANTRLAIADRVLDDAESKLKSALSDLSRTHVFRVDGKTGISSDVFTLIATPQTNSIRLDLFEHAKIE